MAYGRYTNFEKKKKKKEISFSKVAILVEGNAEAFCNGCDVVFIGYQVLVFCCFSFLRHTSYLPFRSNMVK